RVRARSSVVVCLILLGALARAQRPEAAAHVKQGDAYARLGAYDKAVAEYEVAARLDPRPPLTFKTAAAYVRLGQVRRALELYKEYTAAVLEGRLADEARAEIARLTVELRRDDDGDGVPNVDDRCPDQAEDRDGFQDADGCPDPDNDGDGVLDGIDR